MPHPGLQHPPQIPPSNTLSTATSLSLPTPSPSAPHGIIGSGAMGNGVNGRELETILPGQPQAQAPPHPPQPAAKTIGTISDLVSTFQNVQRKGMLVVVLGDARKLKQ